MIIVALYIIFFHCAVLLYFMLLVEQRTFHQSIVYLVHKQGEALERKIKSSDKTLQKARELKTTDNNKVTRMMIATAITLAGSGATGRSAKHRDGHGCRV